MEKQGIQHDLTVGVGALDEADRIGSGGRFFRKISDLFGDIRMAQGCIGRGDVDAKIRQCADLCNDCALLVRGVGVLDTVGDPFSMTEQRTAGQFPCLTMHRESNIDSYGHDGRTYEQGKRENHPRLCRGPPGNDEIGESLQQAHGPGNLFDETGPESGKPHCCRIPLFRAIPKRCSAGLPDFFRLL